MGKVITEIIFDLDGTLIDSAPSILECFKKVLATNNIEPLYPLNSDLIGPPLLQTLSRLTGINDLTLLNTLAEDFKARYDFDGYKSTLPFHGVSELLQECSASGFSLHIATNKRIKPANLIVEHLGWKQYFKSVYALDSNSPSFSSKAAMLSKLLENEKIDPKTAIYIGDRSEDNESATENSLKFFGASWGYQDAKLLSDEAVTCCHNIKQFMRYLNS